jgi:hypothetical protein
MRADLFWQVVSQANTPTVRDVEQALRNVLCDRPPSEVEEKVGMIYGNAFRANERACDAGKRGRVLR